MKGSFLCFILLSSLQTSLSAEEKIVTDWLLLPEVKPGDTLLLPEGRFDDITVHLQGEGTPEKPITFRASKPGKTILTGKSLLRISGKHLIICGLHFTSPDASVKDWIEFRKDSKHPAHHCRLTECRFDNPANLTQNTESRWLGLYGTHHEVDHCSLEGKTGKGTTVVVWLNQPGDGHHRLHHNYFGPREKLGKNGGETLRVGDSKTSMSPAHCEVDHNLFEKCNGEVECISNKSCNNHYHHNTFLQVSGTLTLRHGNHCLVEHNLFLGENAPGTGGIRIIGEDHIVRNNHLQDLTGDEARSAICLMQGVPDSPLNLYFQVKNALVSQNTLLRCKHPLFIGLSDDKKASLPPIQTKFVANQIHCPNAQVIDARTDLAGITWEENLIVCKTLGIAPNQGILTDLFSPEPTPRPMTRKEVGPEVKN